MMRRLSTTIAISLLLLGQFLPARSDEPASVPELRSGIHDPALDARVETLLRQMTLEE